MSFSLTLSRRDIRDLPVNIGVKRSPRAGVHLLPKMRRGKRAKPDSMLNLCLIHTQTSVGPLFARSAACVHFVHSDVPASGSALQLSAANSSTPVFSLFGISSRSTFHMGH